MTAYPTLNSLALDYFELAALQIPIVILQLYEYVSA